MRALGPALLPEPSLLAGSGQRVAEVAVGGADGVRCEDAAGWEEGAYLVGLVAAVVEGGVGEMYRCLG